MGSCRSHMVLAALAFALLIAGNAGTSRAAEEVRIYRPDGSVQCGSDGVAKNGRSLAEDRATLEAIGAKVIAEEKKQLPAKVITLCGVPTGSVNTFVVSAEDWKKIQSTFVGPAGFAIWPYDSQTVIVFQYDGSKQCEGDSGMSLDDMAKVLTGAGIEVRNRKQAHDGLLHPAVCGFSTGRINTYEIASSDLDKALGLGFSYLATPDLEVGVRSLAGSDATRDVQTSPWPFPW